MARRYELWHVYVLLRFHPIAALLVQLNKLVKGIAAGTLRFTTSYSLYNVDHAFAGSHLAVVGVRHFAGAVHDAAHEADLDTFQVADARTDPGYGPCRSN